MSQFTSERIGSDERAMLLAFLGDLRGRAVLDLGCTDPDLGRQVLDQGARHYLGLAHERPAADSGNQRLAGTAGEIRVVDLNRWSGHDIDRFDVVVSRFAIHRVRNLARLLETVHHHTVREGRLVFSVPHPMATAGAALPGGNGAGRGWLVREYFREGERPGPSSPGGDRPVQHRCLESYLRELRFCGFRLEEFSEGMPAAGAAASAPADFPQWAVFRCTRNR